MIRLVSVAGNVCNPKKLFCVISKRNKEPAQCSEIGLLASIQGLEALVLNGVPVKCASKVCNRVKMDPIHTSKKTST